MMCSTKLGLKSVRVVRTKKIPVVVVKRRNVERTMEDNGWLIKGKGVKVKLGFK